MFKVYLDGELMYHPNIPEQLPLASGKLDLELNKAGTFKATVYKPNPARDKIRKMKSIIKVYDDNYRLFRGRVYSATRDFHNGLQVTCEGELAFFNDTEIKPYSFQGSVSEYFSFLVARHNDQVEEEKQFKIGRCTVTDPNDYITRESSQYPKTLSELKDKLLDLLGGYLWTREEPDGVYIDYLADFELTNTQRIRFGENLLDLEDVVKGNEVATAIRPLGAKIKDENGNETGERVTIESVNGGLDYVYSPEAVEKYGWIYKTVIFDDVTVPGNLLARGNEELGERIHLSQTIELSAIDLHALQISIQSFRVGRYTIVESPPHDLNTSFLTRKQSINILKPGSDSKLVLGDERQTFVDKQVGQQGEINKVVESTTKVEQNNQAIMSEVLRQYTKIINDCKGLITTAFQEYSSESGEFGAYKETVQSEVSQLAGRIEAVFTEAIQRIQNVDGDLQEKYNTITKYFVFDINGMTIGKVDSPFKVVVDNDKYAMFVNNVAALLLDPDGKSIIPSLIITKTFHLFGFTIEEDEDGRVNCTYAGDEPDEELIAIDDGAGNVTVIYSLLSVSDDGFGNVSILGVNGSHDGSGNVTMTE